jgi:hypothetical protein
MESNSHILRNQKSTLKSASIGRMRGFKNSNSLFFFYMFAQEEGEEDLN